MPNNLDRAGVRAYEAIKKYLRNFEGMSTGGCKAFYSPSEWNKRGEKYGSDSALIIVYDGGDLRPYMSMGDECYSLYEGIRNALRDEGFFIEECTGWYAAVYEM